MKSSRKSHAKRNHKGQDAGKIIPSKKANSSKDKNKLKNEIKKNDLNVKKILVDGDQVVKDTVTINGPGMSDKEAIKPVLKKNKLHYGKELKKLQIELVKLQEWVKKEKAKVVVLFEGRDAAGKGGVIKRITEMLNPRICRVVALGVPTEKEKTQWYFQRFVQHLPAGGEIVLFDRSWYNRAGVEHVMGFCDKEEYTEFLRSCPEFEQMLIRSGIILIKYWFSISDEEQEIRFRERINNPAKRWKFSPMDLVSRKNWVKYSMAKDEMFKYTDTRQCPWFVVEGDKKKKARLNCIAHLLSKIPYEYEPEKLIRLPKLKQDETYERSPWNEQTFVPEIY